MYFNYTAPTFSSSDEVLERESLAPEEKELIDRDQHGLLDFVETEEMCAEGIAKMDEALMALSIASKSGYLQALFTVPKIVARESDHLRFLRSTNFDATLAAEKLALYWNTRVKLFEEKAFLPMSIEGALSDDIDTLRKGSIRLLEDDQHRRSVVYMERGLISPVRHSGKSWLRCVFYIFHAGLERKHMQTEGVVLIISLANYRSEHLDRKLAKELNKSLWHVLPVKIKIVFLPRGGNELKSFFLSIVRYIVGKIVRLRIREYQNHFCFEEFGIYPDSLPRTIGGQNSIVDFHNWLQQRRITEELSG
jgi:hypothetical protein